MRKQGVNQANPGIFPGNQFTFFDLLSLFTNGITNPRMIEKRKDVPHSQMLCE